MDLLAVGFATFVVGVLGGGAFAWLLATMRTRAAMQAALRESDSRGAAAAARAEALARSVEDQRALLDAAKTHLGDTFQTLARVRKSSWLVRSASAASVWNVSPRCVLAASRSAR